MTEKEKTLLAGCLNGEKRAWDAFVLQCSALVYHTIRKTFSLYHTEPRTDLVEDLFQDVFLTVLKDDFKKLRQFRGDRGCSLASWLRIVAVRLTIDFLRKQSAPTVEVTDSLPSAQLGLAPPFAFSFSQVVVVAARNIFFPARPLPDQGPYRIVRR